MDDIVKQAMAKRPNVPSVFGWLGLDRRGKWLIKGERISNPMVADFISRNYEHDAAGRWFFQNGPQRVFVALDYTPFVYRIGWDPDPNAPLHIEAHTGRAVTSVNGAWVDDAGVVLLATEHGPGMIDDGDLDRLLPCFTDEHGAPLTEDVIADALERLQNGGSAHLYFRYRGKTVPLSAIAASDVPAKFDFVPRPAQPAGQEKCY
ncbi:MAG: DUF2946 family protein [Betaproteobacteria bacterium]|nr:DUF2946 family protein [Betaproteobacteria bacterium]